MINMIKADSYRIFRSVGIYIAVAFMLLMIAVSVYSVGPGSIGMATVGDVSTGDAYSTAADDFSAGVLQEMSMSEYREIMLKSEGYELDRAILGQNMNLYYVFIFVAALAITVDFSAGSIKNTLSSAISRKRYFISKAVFVTACCLLLFFLNTYLTYFFNLFFNGKNLASSLWTVTKISLVQLPPVLALISILTGLAFTLKRNAVYNMITIPLVLVFQLLFNLAVKFFGIKQKYIYYELQIMLGRLADKPSESYLWQSYGICAVIIIVFTLTGYLSFRKAEIK